MIFSKEQIAIENEVKTGSGNIIVQATAGCLDPRTEVLMFDGSIRLASQIKVGDELMGMDSTKRTVLATKRGVDTMYRIVPVKGDAWICNSSHVMTVFDSYIQCRNYHRVADYENNPIVDLPLNEVIMKNHSKEGYSRYKLQRTGVDFPESKLVIDPYLVGLWLGDGHTDGVAISTKDAEIIEHLQGVKIEGLTTKVRQDKTCTTVSLTGINFEGKENIFRTAVKSCINVKGAKYINRKYLINSRENRLKLLAGLIDSDGSLSNNYYEISTKLDSLKDDILFLCRSLGFAAYAKCSRKGIKSIGFSNCYWRITISGDISDVPVLLPRKKATARKQIKSVLRTSFKVEKIGKGQWCGFQVDGDNRFLLGDFTITHNSGKTTTLLKCLTVIPAFKKTVFLSFSKTIVDELKERVPRHVKACTLHSLGFGFVNNRYKGVTLDENKYLKIALKALPSTKDQKKQKETFKKACYIKDIVSFARMTLTSLDSESIMAMCRYYTLDFTEEVINIAIGILNDIGKSTVMTMDFADMLYLPVIKPDLVTAHYDFIMVDECQDLNSCQLEFIRLIGHNKSRYVLVGDACQAIYAFAGANVDSFEKAQEKFNCKRFTLPVSYRCAKNVVEFAQGVYDVIQPAPNAIEGDVRLGSINEVEEGDMVLCRNTLPLIYVFFDLIERNIKATIVGKDIENGLIEFAKSVMGYSIDQVERNMQDNLLALVAELRELGYQKPETHKKYEALVEKIRVINVILHKIDSPNQLIFKIHEIFHEDKKAARLMTLHKGKGLESNRVFIIESYEKKQLVPSKYASQEWEFIAESNLNFVGYTRAKKELILVEM